MSGNSEPISFYYAPRTRSFTTLWLLEEIGAPYRIIHVDLAKGDHKREDFVARNRMGKVPLVIDRSVPISETGAILATLADRYSAGELAPPIDAAERGPYLRWLFFGAAVIEPAYAEKFFNWEAPSSQVGWGSFADMVATAEDGVAANAWIAGDRFTAADIYIASQLRFGMLFGVISGESPLAGYVARATDREAFRRAEAIEARHAGEVPTTA